MKIGILVNSILCSVKCTLDAIALSGLKVGDGSKSIVNVYNKVVEKLLKPNGVFLITSCNFTKQDLIKVIENNNLKVWEGINYPTSEFSCVKGTTICSIPFIKDN